MKKIITILVLVLLTSSIFAANSRTVGFEIQIDASEMTQTQYNVTTSEYWILGREGEVATTTGFITTVPSFNNFITFDLQYFSTDWAIDDTLHVEVTYQGFVGTAEWVIPDLSGGPVFPTLTPLINIITVAPTHTITGNVNDGTNSLSGVLLTGTNTTPAAMTTGADGNYSFTADAGVNVTITPSKTGYEFTPPSLSITGIDGDHPDEDFVAAELDPQAPTNGDPTGTDVAFDVGQLTWEAPTTGVTPTNYIVTFSVNPDYSAPLVDAQTTTDLFYNIANLEYGTTYYVQVYANYDAPARGKQGPSITANARGMSASALEWNFTTEEGAFTISGNVNDGTNPMSGVLLTGTNTTPAAMTTTADGNYSFTADAGDDVTITPSKTGYEFTPPSLGITGIDGDHPDEDFVAAELDPQAPINGDPTGTDVAFDVGQLTWEAPTTGVTPTNYIVTFSVNPDYSAPLVDAQTTTDLYYDIANLEYGTIYYVQVYANYDAPARSSKSGLTMFAEAKDRGMSDTALEWSFTTEDNPTDPNPNCASNPVPANTAMDVAIDTNISWDYYHDDAYTEPVGYKFYMDNDAVIGAPAINAWINEIHYDNDGTDTGEMIEVVVDDAGSYTISDFAVYKYNGNGGTNYGDNDLSEFTEGATVNGFTYYYFTYPSNGLQNGAPDGVALTYQGTVMDGQFLSYEGDFTATAGPANGLTSVDIGVSEPGDTPVGYSLQLGGSGFEYNDFYWQEAAAETPGASNNNQSMLPEYGYIAYLGEGQNTYNPVENFAYGTSYYWRVVPTTLSPSRELRDDAIDCPIWVFTTVENELPIAEAGPDQTVDEGTLVNLDGSASSDPEGATLVYDWYALSGDIMLIDAETATPSFTAPDVDTETIYPIVLKVNDGVMRAWSLPDTVYITVNNTDIPDEPPFADAGEDQIVDEGDMVYLNGSGSFDPEEAGLVYSWVALSPDITLIDPFTVAPSFEAPQVDEDTIYSIELTVSDNIFGRLFSEPDTVDVTVLNIIANQPPIADAGPDQIVPELSLVTLDGSASYDPDEFDEIGNYYWTAPAEITLTDGDTAMPSFIAPDVDSDTIFEFILEVSNFIPTRDFSLPDTVAITVLNDTTSPNPACAINPTPADMAVDVALDADLGWDYYHDSAYSVPAGFWLYLDNDAEIGTPTLNAWINELHYDNASGDVGEMVEVVIENAGDYTLSDFSVHKYNGSNGTTYGDNSLDEFTVGYDADGYTFYYLTYPANGLQNGAPDAIALVYQGTVIDGQFLSYEGTLTATDGPANGLTSIDIGVSEGSSSPAGESLQLGGIGIEYNDFYWQEASSETPGANNNNQFVAFNSGEYVEYDTEGSYTYDLLPNLNYGTTYYWTVIPTTLTPEVGERGDAVDCPVWSFSTIENQLPVAIAGPDQEVDEGTLVNLDGSASYDPEGAELSYNWYALDWQIDLIDDDTATPSFVAPDVDVETIYPIVLEVNDGVMREWSLPDTVYITVNNNEIPNTPPLAITNDDFSIDEGLTGMLDGTASYDMDADTLTYLWTGIIPLDDNTLATPSFVAPQVEEDTEYEFVLVVNDGIEDSEPATVVVTVLQVNQAPIADAGPDQIVPELSLVTLDGSASYDIDELDELSYAWTAPAEITLSGADTTTPSFTAPDVDDDTEFEFVLIVNDLLASRVASEPDTVIITVLNDTTILDPNCAITPTPADMAVDIALDTDLGWDFYLETDYTVPSEFKLYFDNDTEFGAPTLNAWINELHYDNASSDVNEMVEVVIEDAGSYMLSDFAVYVYNGNNSLTYGNVSLDAFTVGATVNGYTFYYYTYPANGLQNGSPDGLALSYQGTVLDGQFLTYEGVITAADGPANGLTSIDIGVEEHGGVQIGESLQLGGIGWEANDLYWQEASAETPGAINNNQTLTMFMYENIAYTADGTYSYDIPVDLNFGTTYYWQVIPATEATRGDAVDCPIWSFTTISNEIPVAIAGIDQMVDEGVTVNLDGSASYDPEGAALTYNWYALDWTIDLIGDDTATPSFVAPDVDVETIYPIVLEVNDGVMREWSLPDTVYITVNNVIVNQPPIADAGPDQIVLEETIVTLDGSGSYDPDGDEISYLWNGPLTLSDPTIANPTFTTPDITADTDYEFTLVVSDGEFDSTLDTVVITVEFVNQLPIADAGLDQDVVEEAVVILDGSGSYDPDGDELSYLWTAPEGILLDDVTAINPTFTAPDVTENTDLQFSLVVDDGYYIEARESSAPDFVVISVIFDNQIPIADAGADQTVAEETIVTLDGSGSYDPDGDELSYLWTAPEGILLDDVTAINPTFTAPTVSVETDYEIMLVVNDNSGNRIQSLPDYVIITVENIEYPPIADAGEDFSIAENMMVTLDGSGSYDPDGDEITYNWIAPAGITLDDPTVVAPTFMAPDVTEDIILTFSLTVNDGVMRTESDPDEVMVTILFVNQIPVADAGEDFSAIENTMVMLDGTGSYDLDGQELTYIWTAPEGITLDDPTSATPGFMAPDVSMDTDYVFELVVDDGETMRVVSAPDEVVVTIEFINQLPIADAGEDFSAVENTMVTLNGSGSYDPDGDAITYHWIAPNQITLDDPYVANPTFTAPNVYQETDYTFTLVVDDGRNISRDEAEDQVVVTVMNFIYPYPVCTIDPMPYDGEDDVELDAEIGWSYYHDDEYSEPTEFKVLMAYDEELTNPFIGYVPFNGEGEYLMSHPGPDFDYETEYFWQVIPVSDDSRDDAVDCSVWSFSTIIRPTFEVSGYVGVEAIVDLGNGNESDNDGFYNVIVGAGDDLTLTPELEGWDFDPVSVTFNNIQDDIVQNFAADIWCPGAPTNGQPIGEGVVIEVEELSWDAPEEGYPPNRYFLTMSDHSNYMNPILDEVEVFDLDYSLSEIDLDYSTTYYIRVVANYLPEAGSEDGCDGPSLEWSFVTVPETDADDDVPDNVTKLIGNYPNPFNPQTTISFVIMEGDNGYLTIFNSKGQVIETQTFDSGNHEYVWNAETHASGVYFYTLETKKINKTKKMILLK